jgi:hypothetical protein
MGGFAPQNVISGVLFLASFHNNDVSLSQFQVIIAVLQSFIESLTVVLPYSPVGKSQHRHARTHAMEKPSQFGRSLLNMVLRFMKGTMERVIQEGQVATAATYAHMFSSLPSCGRPTRLMVYDLHTLQNRFYLVSF